jgi:hypothetical protein
MVGNEVLNDAMFIPLLPKICPVLFDSCTYISKINRNEFLFMNENDISKCHFQLSDNLDARNPINTAKQR